MHCLHDHGQVVAVRGRGVGGVTGMERDPVRDTGFAGVGLGQFDRRLVEVEAVHGGVGIAARDGDGGPAGAAGDIRHPRPGLQLRMHVGDLWQVLGGERVHQPRPVEIALRLDGVRSFDADSLAGAVGVDECREHAPESCE